MTKKVVLTVSALLLVLGVLGGIKGMQIAALIASGESFLLPPASVATASVREESWRPQLTAVGSVHAAQGVMVSPEVSGTVRTIAFESGAVVRKGALLVRLDTSAEQARLSASEARSRLAEVTLGRARALRASASNTQSDLDAATANAEQAAAEVQDIRAAIGKKTIRAPFSGRLGIREVDVGEYVGPGTPIVSLQSFDPIHVDFWMPQRNLAVLESGLEVSVSTDAFPEADLRGAIETISPEVDPTTRNVRVRAVFGNPDGVLRPGMFADVTVLLPERQPVVTVPATSVVHAPYGDSVFVLSTATPEGYEDPVRSAEQRFVRLGERRGDLVAVSDGVRPGETVVSSGAFKLRNGMPVTVNNDMAIEAALAPEPKDS